MTSETVADPPSATFDMYGNEPPPGDWSYIVDDTGTEYGPGWFPFYRSRLGEGPQSVRLAPDTAYRAWRNEYVLLGPGRARSEVEERQWAWADLTLYVRRQGMGAMVVRTIVELNIKTREIIVAPDCPDALRAQADAKAERLLALILAARADRRTRDRPITAHERWVESQPPPRVSRIETTNQGETQEHHFYDGYDMWGYALDGTYNGAYDRAPFQRSPFRPLDEP